MMDSVSMDALDAVTDTVGEAAILRLRADLMTAIRLQIEDRGLTDEAAAQVVGLTRSRIEAFRLGRLDKFSIEDLITIGVEFGVRAVVPMPTADHAH